MVVSSHAWLIEKLNTSIDCQRGGGDIWLLFPTLGCLKKIKELRNFWKRHIRCSFAIFERTWSTYHTVNICCVVIVISWYTAGTSGSPVDRINRRAKKYKFKLRFRISDRLSFKIIFRLGFRLGYWWCKRKGLRLDIRLPCSVVWSLHFRLGFVPGANYTRTRAFSTAAAKKERNGIALPTPPTIHWESGVEEESRARRSPSTNSTQLHRGGKARTPPNLMLIPITTMSTLCIY